MSQPPAKRRRGRPKKVTKDSVADAEMSEWVLKNIREFLSESREVCRGNPNQNNQQVRDALACACLHNGPPPTGKMAAFMRVTGFSRGMIDRAEKMRVEACITPVQLKTPNSSFHLSRQPQSSGPKKKRQLKWVYDWFHDESKNPMIYVDKSRPEHYKGVRIKIKIDGVVLKVQCQRHFMTGTKKEMAQYFLACPEYKAWQKENPGDSLPLKTVQSCICPCMRPAQVKECACPICTEMQAALSAWHEQRQKWQEDKCQCKGCSDPARFAVFCQASKSLVWFRAMCLCKKIEFPELQMPNLPDEIPTFRKIECCKYDEKYPEHVQNSCEKCGVEKRLYFHEDCIERDGRKPASWMQWEKTEVDAAEESGGKAQRMVYREVKGTRKMLLDRIRALAKPYFYHHWVHSVTSYMGKLRNAT